MIWLVAAYRSIKSGREFFLARPMPTSKWRRRAREVIVEILDADVNLKADTVTLVKHVDAAYPFGERAYAPYKAWLEERRILIGDLEDVAPSAAEWGAIEVAIDMQEDGRPETEIAALLDEQAPHRHMRKCGACAAAKGKPCREARALSLVLEAPREGTPDEIARSSSATTTTVGRVTNETEYVDRLIPHAARVQP